MNFTALKFGAAIATAATAATFISNSPAQALSLSDPSLRGVLSINAPGLVRSVESNFVDFGVANNVAAPGTTILAQSVFASGLGSTGSTGSFANILSGTIRDLPISTSFPAGGIPSFVTVTDASGSVQFDLVSLFAPNLISNPSGVQGVFQAELRGFFRPTNQANVVGDALQARLTAANNLLTIELTPVPTPALLPAAIGFGMAMLRKRKGEAAEAEQETAEVKA